MAATLFPPVLVRLLARVPNGKPLSDVDIAIRADLTPAQVLAISWSTTWHGIGLPTMRKFVTGCGVDFCSAPRMHAVQIYIQEQIRLGHSARSNWTYLRRSPEWKTLYAPMMRAYQRSL